MSAHSTASLRLRSVIMKDGQRLLCCDHLEQDGEGLDRMACEHGLEAEELSQIHPDLQAWKKMGGFRAPLVLASAALRGLHLRRGEMSRIISRRCGISSHCALRFGDGCKPPNSSKRNGVDMIPPIQNLRVLETFTCRRR